MKDELSRKEAQVLTYLARGYVQKEIAIELHVSAAAVKKQAGRAVQKLGARNTTHAVALTLKEGHIKLPE